MPQTGPVCPGLRRIKRITRNEIKSPGDAVIGIPRVLSVAQPQETVTAPALSRVTAVPVLSLA